MAYTYLYIYCIYTILYNCIDNLNNFFTCEKDTPTSTLNLENPSQISNSCEGNIKSEDQCCSESLKELRQKNLKSPVIAQLSINSIRNKFQFLEKEVCANLSILLISKTKLDDSFHSAKLLLDEMSEPYRPGRCSNDGGILLNIRDDITSCLLLNSYKTGSIITEINFRKKERLICASYNPYKSNISDH